MSENDETLKVIDYDQALENAAGDKGIFEAVCASAILEIPSLYPNLVKSIQKGETQEAQRLAHTIKGAARVIAAVKTKSLAEAVEAAIANGEIKTAETLLVPLLNAIEELKIELEGSV